jgi:Protein of unknown function (DUF998)
MTSTALEDTSAAISIRAARLAIGAIVFYQVVLILLIFLRPDIDPSWHTVSEWAIGPHGWMMSTALFISALSYAALFVTLKSQVRGLVGRTGRGTLLICSIGAAGAGMFTTDPMPLHFPLSARGTLHVMCGTSQLVLFPFAALLISFSLARNNQTFRTARRTLLWTAGLPLFGFLSFAVYSAVFVFPLGPGAYGPGVNIGWPPRFAFLTYALWVVTLSLQAIKCSPHSAVQPNSRNENHNG